MNHLKLILMGGFLLIHYINSSLLIIFKYLLLKTRSTDVLTPGCLKKLTDVTLKHPKSNSVALV